MPFDIRDLSTIKNTLANLGKLIEACRPRGPFYSHDKEVTNEVIRGAKALHTSLEKLQRAVDDPHHKASEAIPSAKGALGVRLYQEPHLYEMARFVSYGGRRPGQMKAFMAEHRQKHGDKAMWAMHELTMADEASGLTVLRPEARKACRVLLGPTPESEEYAVYWQRQGRDAPIEHLPPPPEEAQGEPETLKKPKGSGRRR